MESAIILLLMLSVRLLRFTCSINNIIWYLFTVPLQASKLTQWREGIMGMVAYNFKLHYTDVETAN